MTNVVALVQPLPTTLAGMVDYINGKIAELDRVEDREDRAKGAAMNMRLAVGYGLIVAREELTSEQPETTFKTWVEANIRRSLSDCYACIRLAESLDRLGPCTAPILQDKIWNERHKWREAKAKSRAMSAREGQDGYVTQPQSKRVQSAIGTYRRMTVEEREEFKRALEEIDHA